MHFIRLNTDAKSCLKMKYTKPSSDSPVEGSPFTLVNTEGEVIPGDQLGLVLYKRGGTLCFNEYSDPEDESKAANAICREMNYEFAFRWTDTDNSLMEWDFTALGYYPELTDVACATSDWKNCTYRRPDKVHDYCASMSNYMMLSCAGILSLTSMKILYTSQPLLQLRRSGCMPAMPLYIHHQLLCWPSHGFHK